MHADDFYQSLSEFSSLFEQYGLKKKTKNSYLFPNNVRVQFVLNKWGWTADVGTGFLIRLSDAERLPDGLNPELIADVTPSEILQRKMIPNYILEKVYSSVPKPVYQYYLDGSWFQYYSNKQLRELLAVVLPHALALAREYSKAQEHTRGSHISRPQPMSEEKLAQINHDLNKMIEDI